MTNDSHKARLATLVQELSVIHEKVTLASGRESDFYVDMRRSTLHHEAAPLIGTSCWISWRSLASRWARSTWPWVA